MYWILWLGLIIFFLVIQTVFADVLSIEGVKPDILLIIIVFFAFKSSYVESGIVGFVSGLLQDGLSGCVSGVNAFSKIIVALLTNLIKRAYPAKLIPIGFSILIGTLINSILNSFFNKTTDGLISIKKIIIESLYNILIGSILFPLLSKLKWYSGSEK